VPQLEKLFDIIFEDDGLLVVNKPAGLVCHPTKGDVYSSLISRARLHLGPASHPQLVNRLDRETSGVTVLAKDETVARELRRVWERREVTKEYLAIVHGHVADSSGVISAPLGKDEQSRVAIKDCVRLDGATATTEFWVEQRFVRTEGDAELPYSLLRLRPFTGRKHQLRIHLAHLGHPIVGDKIYGGDEDLYLALVEDRLTPEQRQRLKLPHHALHACALRFSRDGAEALFQAEPEPWFNAFLEGSIS
jgi:23S rRNA pseudouridine1911/1915/1917 synthase